MDSGASIIFHYYVQGRESIFPLTLLCIISVILFIQKTELLTWYPRLDIQYLIPVQFDYEWPL